MTREIYRLIENYMLECIDPRDYAHGAEHVYRVLHSAMDIAVHEKNVNYDILVCACLLHDIGRKAQSENPAIRHPIEGAEMARTFLIKNGFGESFANHVTSCIRVHSTYDDRTDSIEAKILYDSDKLDVVGSLGIARTLLYSAQHGEPLYSRDSNGNILDGSGNTGEHSFLHEYHHDLQKTANGFHTVRATEIAAQRRQIAESFYHSLISEIREAECLGRNHLKNLLQ